MAQTAAQKKAAAQKAANQQLLAKAEAALSKSKAKLSALENPSTVKASDYATRNAGFEATGEIRTPEEIEKILNPPKVAATPVAPVDTKFPRAGTIIRYKAGSLPGTRIAVYADGKGGEYEGAEELITVVPGSGGGNLFAPERTLASDTFKNTLALLMGNLEASQPWVQEIFNLASGFYKTGSTIEEALNLSLYDAKAKGMAPAFTKRFDGVFKLQERLNKGEAIEVPTIAEFIKSESAIGDVLRQAGMADLANQEFLGTVLGLGKSVAEVTTLIDDTFNRIDNAPEALKKDLQVAFPGVSRTDIAKAMLLGPEGAKALNKKIEGLTVMSAAKSQGIGIDTATSADLAARGYDYTQSLTGFGTVKRLERGQMLGKMSGIDLTQQEAIASTFAQDVKAQDKIAKIAEEEVGRFSSRSGRLASQNRSTAGLI